MPWRLLLVDDNPVNLKVAAFLCRQLWPLAEVHSVNSGQACLDVMRARKIDMILMDLVMPGMDGLQTTRAIRSAGLSLWRDIAIIGLTASSHPQDHEDCLAAGMNDVLVKPLNRTTMQTCIEHWLGRRSGEQHG